MTGGWIPALAFCVSALDPSLKLLFTDYLLFFFLLGTPLARDMSLDFLIDSPPPSFSCCSLDLRF